MSHSRSSFWSVICQRSGLAWAADGAGAAASAARTAIAEVVRIPAPSLETSGAGAEMAALNILPDCRSAGPHERAPAGFAGALGHGEVQRVTRRPSISSRPCEQSRLCAASKFTSGRVSLCHASIVTMQVMRGRRPSGSISDAQVGTEGDLTAYCTGDDRIARGVGSDAVPPRRKRTQLDVRVARGRVAERDRVPRDGRCELEPHRDREIPRFLRLPRRRARTGCRWSSCSLSTFREDAASSRRRQKGELSACHCPRGKCHRKRRCWASRTRYSHRDCSRTPCHFRLPIHLR